jgi:hypothetical protein
MIIKTKNKYKVVSHLTGRSFGTYKTKKKAQERLRQIKYFQKMKGGEK